MALAKSGRKVWWIIGLSVAVIAVLVYFFAGSDKQAQLVTSKVEFGDFYINVTTSGELEAANSENILGPANLREVRIWQVQISDIIPEGSIVDSGQYVATLDRTEITNRMKDLEGELEKLESQFIKTKLDTSMDMRAAREELINLKYALEERQITVDQSIYEPPATQRQAKIDLEKAQRGLEQAEKNFKLRSAKNTANMQEVAVSFSQAQRRLEQIREVLKGFTVTAPKEGMVIYKRNWDGSRIGIGSTMSSWDNVVATLPNLDKMISRTYVNEIDISKVKIGQKVEIGVDAFPDRKYSGEVTEVANIGEQMRNSNAKVFEVKIKVYEFDSILRPAMTTKNIINTATIPNVIFIPIESVNTTDSISFVYKVNGQYRQQVKTGLTNENQIIITEGLEKDDEVYLSPPEKAASWRLKTL